jgi:hypothetical protein
LAPDDDDEGRGVRLLADIRTIFTARDTHRIASADLVTALVEIKSAPWGEVNHGRSLTTHTLARLLKPYAIHPATRRDGKGTFKGYLKAGFEEAWDRYLPEPTPKGTADSSHRHNPQKSSASGGSEPSQAGNLMTVLEPRKPALQAECDGVTVSDPDPSPPKPTWEVDLGE